MKRIHVAGVALLLGISAALGLFAATRTAGLSSQTQRHASNAAIVARTHRLDQVERALRRALRDRPPALPAVPRASQPVSAPQVVYRRPAPIVVIKHTSHHDSEREADSEGGGGGDD